jgi:hypothetical protein
VGFIDDLMPYAIFRFVVDNSRTTIIRDYPLIYSIFSQAGGVIVVLAIIFAAINYIEKEVLLETHLLNQGVLNTDVSGAAN